MEFPTNQSTHHALNPLPSPERMYVLRYLYLCIHSRCNLPIVVNVNWNYNTDINMA